MSTDDKSKNVEDLEFEQRVEAVLKKRERERDRVEKEKHQPPKHHPILWLLGAIVAALIAVLILSDAQELAMKEKQTHRGVAGMWTGFTILSGSCLIGIMGIGFALSSLHCIIMGIVQFGNNAEHS
jgi:hypothetical protein